MDAILKTSNRIQAMYTGAKTLILLVHIYLCSGVCEECSVTYLPSLDDVRITDYQLWSRPAPSKEICFRLCWRDATCVTYQFNSDSGTCSGHTVTSTTGLQVTPDTGNKLYITCRGKF